MSTTIRTTGLTKVYEETTVVSHLDLEIEAGEIFGLLGPNGAGKTTTILMLLGLIEPTSGEIEVVGLDPRRSPIEVKQRVGFLPDAVGFYDTLTGRQNLRFTARLNNTEDADRRIDRLLSEVGLADAADQSAGEYSRGMKQRLGLADALVKEPSVLILDEPTTAIDPEGVAEMLELIGGLATNQNVTVLLSSHLLHQVQTICDRVAIFVNGEVVAQGRPDELAAAQSGPTRVEFRLGATNPNMDESLASSEWISNVTPGRSGDTWTVDLDPTRLGETVRDLSNRGIDITGVRRLDDDLDAIYRRYFSKAKETQR